MQSTRPNGLPMLAKGSWIIGALTRQSKERQDAMVFTAIHMAVGMVVAGLAGLAISTRIGRGWRWIPVAMTAGALWAIIPDVPAMYREHLQHLPLVGILGSHSLEATLQNWGNVFFGHRLLQDQLQQMPDWGLAAFLLIAGASLTGVALGGWREHEQASQGLKMTSFDAGHRMDQVRSSHLSRSA